MEVTRYDATGKKGIPSEVKIGAYIRIIRTGCSFDDIESSAQMGRRTIRMYSHRFCSDVTAIYGATYLNVWPTPCQLATVEPKYADDDFIGCAGSGDYSNLIWKNCYTSLKGQYLNRKDVNLPTIKAWYDRDLYVCH